MNYRQLASLILAGLVCPLTAETFTGEPGTVPSGWHFFKPGSKMYYRDGAKIKDKHSGIIEHAEEGKIVRVPLGWNFDRADIDCKETGILEFVMNVKSEKGNAVLKAKFAGNAEPYEVGDDWTELRFYHLIKKPCHVRLYANVAKGKAILVKDWSVKMLPLDENRESGFLGNPGKLPFLWFKTSWKNSDFSNSGITQDEGFLPYQQSFKISGDGRLSVMRTYPDLILGKAGDEMEFSIWMKGNASKGVKLWLVDKKWKWVRHKTFVPDSNWKKYTLQSPVTPEVAGHNYTAIIDTDCADILIGKYYIGTVKKEAVKTK